MFESIHEVAVLVSTLLAVAIGSIWYSPLLFGVPWMRSVGLTEADMEASKKKMPVLFAAAVLANAVALTIIAKLIAVSREAGINIQEVGMLLVLLIGAFIANAVIWEGKSISYLLINLGYIAVVIFMGIAVIGFWPW